VYQAKDMNFAVVLGKAVLLTHGEYDEELAGVSEDELRAHTLATIEHYAATNRLDRLTKFSGEPKYEPEARAEIAVSYRRGADRRRPRRGRARRRAHGALRGAHDVVAPGQPVPDGPPRPPAGNRPELTQD
jgi:hypothetical protein